MYNINNNNNMKKIFLSIMMAFLVVEASAQKTYALITGVSNYEGTANDLQQSSKDAKNIAAIYKSKGATVFTLTSSYATKEKIIETIKKIASVAKPSDHIVFTYSGHGSPNMICTYTTGNQQMMSYSDLFDELRKCNAKDITCFIDACFSGSASMAAKNNDVCGKNYLKSLVKADNRLVLLLSSRDDEYSMENPAVGAGFFTRAFLKGIRGKSDANGDKKITVLELFKYMYKDVKLHSNGRQHPQLVAAVSQHNNILMTW